MSPQPQDQSNKEPLKEAAGYPNYPHSQTSAYYSLQIHHIKHNGKKFQMSKECFPTTTTHNTPINKIKTPTSQIITHEYLISSYNPNKKGNSPRGLNFPNTFLRKDNGEGNSQLIIK